MESNQLKGGHPPAMKVGGMRVPHHKHISDADKFKEMELSDPYGIMRANPSPFTPIATNISGAVARGNADFPTEAVQNYHDKPMPSLDGKTIGNKPYVIHQPRK